jgi:hypothetical protein
LSVAATASTSACVEAEDNAAWAAAIEAAEKPYAQLKTRWSDLVSPLFSALNFRRFGCFSEIMAFFSNL